MIPIFFPTTFISQPTLDMCQEWFEKIIVYQPSDLYIPENYKKNNRLIVKMPLASQLDIQKFKQEKQSLNALITESGFNLDYLKGRSEDIPFFDESSVNRIRAQIKQKTHQQDQADHKSLLFSLYCQLFQDFDIQQDELDRTLSETDQSHMQLFQALNNETSEPIPESKNIEKKGVLQIQERLKIWFYLYQFDHEKSEILLTDNHDVISEIQEWNDDLNLKFSINPSQMVNAKQFLKDTLNIQLHQLSLAPEKTKKMLLYHTEKPLVGPFIPSNFTHCGNIWIIELE
jgi:hypothetical protein